MERKKLTDEQIALLKTPLPAAAVSQHPTKTYLSSIKAIYVTERLNEVFGIGSWQFKSQFIEKIEGKGMVVVYATLTIPEYGIELSSFGGNDNGGENSKNFDLGDAYKGASTDALTKIGSWLEIGIDVFKGNKSAPPANTKPSNTSNPATTTQPEDDKPWLSEDQYKAMLAAIDTGKWRDVQDRMSNYKMKKEYREKLNQAIKDITSG